MGERKERHLTIVLESILDRKLQTAILKQVRLSSRLS